MKGLKVREILSATGGKLIRGREDDPIEGFSIDSRTISPNAFFIPLRGKRFDGHAFVAEAKERGAKGVIFSQEMGVVLPIMIAVADTKEALGQIAKYYRNKFRPKVVAITGSNGKTTVKEMVAHIAQRKYRVLKAKESFNNDIGVPLTLLELNDEIEVLILEMEMNELGGIRRLCEMSSPQIGVITNISETHLEFMKTKEGVASEKRELLESLPVSGTAILNRDDPLVMKISEGFKGEKITFGLASDADFFAQNPQYFPDFTITLLNKKYRLFLPSVGEGNLYNSLASIAVARALGIELTTAISSLSDFRSPSLRYQIVNLKSYKILLDCYNANPVSMREALKTLKIIAPKRKIGVLGDMKELGKDSERLHYQLGQEAKRYLDFLIALGEFGGAVVAGARKEGMPEDKTFPVKDTSAVLSLLLDILKPYDTILVKGSRALCLETIYFALKEIYDRKR